MRASDFAAAMAVFFSTTSASQDWESVGLDPNYAAALATSSEYLIASVVDGSDAGLGLWVTDLATLDGTWALRAFSDQRTGEIWIDPDSDSHWLVAVDGDVQQTLDAGLTWEPMGLDVPAGRVSALSVSSDNVAVYAAVVGDAETGGVYLTLDWGVSWSRVLEGDAWDVAASSLDASVAWSVRGSDAGFGSVLHRSWDQGSSWQEIITCFGRFGQLATNNVYGGVVLTEDAACGSGVLLIEESGSFDSVAIPQSSLLYTSAVSPWNGADVVVGSFPTETSWILRSADGGANWAEFDSGLPAGQQAVRALHYSTESSSDVFVSLDRYQGEGAGGVYRAQLEGVVAVPGEEQLHVRVEDLRVSVHGRRVRFSVGPSPSREGIVRVFDIAGRRVASIEVSDGIGYWDAGCTTRAAASVFFAKFSGFPEVGATRFVLVEPVGGEN